MATHKTGWMKKLINGVSTKIFAISHVKAIYYDYANSKTLKSKLDEMDTSISGKASSTHTHSAATTSAAGFMSAADKTKLNGIATGANKTTVDSALSSTSTNPVQNKVVNTEMGKRMNKENPAGTGRFTINGIGTGTKDVCMGDNSNTSDGAWSATIGGSLNSTSGNSHAVVGGQKNKVNAKANYCSGIFCGYTNTISGGNYNSITGGYTNTISAGNYSSITGGNNNNIKHGNDNAIIGGNTNNIKHGNYNAIIGGNNNEFVAPADSGEYQNSAIIGGHNNTTKNYNSVILGGSQNKGNGDSAIVAGFDSTGLDHQVVIGHSNNTSMAPGSITGYTGTGTNTLFCIGNGTSSAKSNAFRVNANGATIAKSAYSTSGADYAEFFEWDDGNPDNEDRRGLFVTIDGDKIKKASAGDYIIGIVSAMPSVIGNYDEEWMGRYLLDDFGAFIEEKFNTEYTIIDEETNEEKIVKTQAFRWKENPDYNPELEYVPREKRQEWSPVGMLGVLNVRDDGSCQVNGFCRVIDGGIATSATTGYRVIKRVTDNIVKVILK